MTQDWIASMRDHRRDVATPHLEIGDDVDPYLVLTIERARKLSDRELHQRVRAIVQDLEATYGRDRLPTDFPLSPSAMSREELLAAVQSHASWFNPKDAPPQPAPARQT
jgi:hypothetical protein